MIFTITLSFIKGISSFLAGQIISHAGLNISETFQAFSIYCSSAATIFFIIYIVKGRKLEVIRIEKVEKERAEQNKGHFFLENNHLSNTHRSLLEQRTLLIILRIFPESLLSLEPVCLDFLAKHM